MHGELPKRLTQAAAATRGRRLIGASLVLIAVAAALIFVFATPTAKTNRPGRFAAQGPVPVLTTEAARADVPVYLDAVGTSKPLNTVTVRPQVDGRLLEVAFKEGQDVKKGDVLARIDPAIYKAQLDQAMAKKAQDEAQLGNAQNDLVRYQALAATNAINKQQADTQRALVAQYTALVAADQAAIENAQATLGYTTITAPISGRTGIRMVDEGNYVRASDANSAVVVITQLKPISVVFNLPQQDLDRVNSAFAQGPLRVKALRSDSNAVITHGTLTVVDNQIDPSTGTVKLKAEFANTDMQLWPGQFVNVQLLIDTLKQVVVIPTGAVQRGPDGTFVYVVKPDNTVTMRDVDVQKQDETQAVIRTGVAPPERVVTTGFARLTEGAKVTIGNSATPGVPAGTPSREGQQPAAVGQSQRRRGDGGNAPKPPR
jgi:multidrug efflux system membrane fusion protein